jgi:hypothetical protein
MANRRDIPNRNTATDRQKAAQAILQGYADSDIAAVLSTAATAGFIYGKITSHETGGTVS